MPYFDDDGNEIDPATIRIPSMCRMCEKFGDENEQILCDLTRIDQADRPTFQCYAFVGVYGVLNDDIIE